MSKLKQFAMQRADHHRQEVYKAMKEYEGAARAATTAGNFVALLDALEEAEKMIVELKARIERLEK